MTLSAQLQAVGEERELLRCRRTGQHPVPQPACACHQPSHTPQVDSKFKIPAGKNNLLLILMS
jgi:hypothetical protein